MPVGEVMALPTGLFGMAFAAGLATNLHSISILAAHSMQNRETPEEGQP